MLYKLFQFGTVLGGLVLMAPIGSAQNPDTGAQQPVPANPPPEGNGTAAAPKAAASGAPLIDEQEVQPDTNALAGAQNLTLGLPPSGHTFLLPSFGVSFQAQTSPYSSGQANNPEVIDNTDLMGRLALNKSSGRSNLLLDYMTGASFSTDSTQGTYGVQNLHFSDMIHSGRWSTMIGDQFSYTPESPFGFGGLGSLNDLGVGLGGAAGTNSGFQNSFLPAQSILVDGSPQIGNAAIGEVDYALSHRASLSFAGSYGLLDFVHDGFQDSSNASFQGGYNYLLDRQNSIAVFYRYGRTMFSGLSQGVQDHSVQLTYARRITGRLSFQVSAGPDEEIFTSPLAGPSSALSWTGSAGLKYQYHFLGAGFSYNHSVTGGSGLLPGAQTDLFSGNFNRVLNKDWDAAISVGYSRNHGFQQTSLNAGAAAPQAWFTAAQVNRRFVRYGSLFLTYSASGQSSLATICTLPACRVSPLSNSVTIGYNWGLRPIVIE